MPLGPNAHAQAVLPTGFADVPVATTLDFPATMARMPDGRVLFTEKGTNEVRLISRMNLVVTPVGTVDSVDNVGERGLLGVAVDPQFPARPYVYVQYDVLAESQIRISRFKLTGDLAYAGNGEMTWDPASRYDVLAGLPDNTSSHNGGTLRFGPDGMLYSSLGNDLAPCDAADLTQLLGKILRIDISKIPDGPGGPPDQFTIAPSNNPFLWTDNPNAALVYLKGMRNPFIYQVDPVLGDLFIADVGDATYEELDHADQPGLDFGYPFFEGPAPTGRCPDLPVPPVTAPIYYYDRTAFLYGAVIITAGRYHAPAVQTSGLPAEYDGNVFVSDVGEGFLRRLVNTGGTWDIAPPVPGQPSPTDWAQNLDGVTDYFYTPEGELWYCKHTEQFVPWTGEIRRIINAAAVAGASAPALRLEFAPPRPQPATGPVTLAWTQPDAAPVTITVTDVAGRQVRRVVDRRSESSGPHAVEWRGDGEDGRRVAPGVYFARLLVGPHSISQRLVVIR
jgi:glucose/arabinose dehydrogenase